MGCARHLCIGVSALPEQDLVWLLHLLCYYLHGPRMPWVEEGCPRVGHSEVARGQRREVRLRYFLCHWIHLHLFPTLRYVLPTIRRPGDGFAICRPCRCMTSESYV